MRTIRDVLIAEGFNETRIADAILPENYHYYDLDCCEEIYKSILSFMKTDFDDWFILAMFSAYPGMFMSSGVVDDLLAIKTYFNSDMWSTYIQYEFSETGTSSAFELMDSLLVGVFEAEMEKVCETIKTFWEKDYGSLD